MPTTLQPPTTPSPSLSSPSGQSPVASPSPSLPDPLFPALFHSLLDPTLTPIQICEYHNLTLTQLTTIMRSEEYKQAAESIRFINDQRAQLFIDNERTQALSLHTDIARDAYNAAKDIDDLAASRDPKLAATKARLLESARKANAKLLPSPSTSRDRKGVVPPSHPHPNRLPRARGGGAERSEAEGAPPNTNPPTSAPKHSQTPTLPNNSSHPHPNRLPRACGAEGVSPRAVPSQKSSGWPDDPIPAPSGSNINQPPTPKQPPSPSAHPIPSSP